MLTCQSLLASVMYREDNNMGHLMAHGYVEESHGKQPTRGNTRKASGNQSKAAAPTRQNDR